MRISETVWTTFHCKGIFEFECMDVCIYEIVAFLEVMKEVKSQGASNIIMWGDPARILSWQLMGGKDHGDMPFRCGAL